MATVGTTGRPAYVYDAETDTWIPVGVGPHSHDNFIVTTLIDTKGDLVVGTANDTAGVLAVGANNTRLVPDSSQATGLKWVADTQNTVIDAKGDLLVGSSNDTLTRIGAGSDGKMLVTDSSTITGLKWTETLAFTIPGNTIGNETVGFSLLGGSDSGNVPSLNLKYYRIAAAAGHSNAEFRVQRKVDASDMGYIGFGDQYVTLGSNNVERMRIDINGLTTFTETIKPSKGLIYTINAQTGTSYTATANDGGALVTMNNSAANIFYINTDAALNFAIGTGINILQIGTGTTTITATNTGITSIGSVGATSNAPKLRTQYSSATAIKIASNLWYIVGDLV